MNITEAKEQVKDTVEAYLEVNDMGLPVIAPKHQRPLFLLGAPGIGKTAIMEQVAQELGIGLVSYSMTHHTRQSALGLPSIITCDFDGFEYQATEYTMSEIISAIYDYMNETGLHQGILFLDEINCVSETLYPSMLQFLQFKTFGRHSVPEGWVVVCAGNPPEYNRSVHEFDIVTLDRLRKVDIEPDYHAWKLYAHNNNVHPAIASFLEIKNDCFYSVQATPSGKRFVTARSWSDLSEVLNLFEALGKTVNKNLVQQFLQDEEIAEQFSWYYELFEKYRSDYQISAILDGSSDEMILKRAQDAPFDESIALMSLILDALSQEMSAALDEEAALVIVRDALRSIKDDVIAGETLHTLFANEIGSWERTLEKQRQTQTLPLGQIRSLMRAMEISKSLLQESSMEHRLSGLEAFDKVSECFESHVSRLQDMVSAIEDRLRNAFVFLEAAYGKDRELLVFTAELTARDASSRFINRFGSDSYYEHNDVLMLESHETSLKNRIQNISSSKSKQVSGVKIIAPRSEFEQQEDASMDSDVTVERKNEMDASDEANRAAETEDAEVSEVSGATEVADATEVVEVSKPVSEKVMVPSEVVDYYAGAQFEFGLPSLCKMTLPSNLKGKTVLDLGCRRGKGLFKLSGRVGDEGQAIGIDWVESYIDEATNRMDRAWKDSGLSGNNMEFHQAYPEYLMNANIADNSIDLIFVNSVSNLFYDREAAYREMYRVLKPGGCIINETVLASGVRDDDVVTRALAVGNSVQSAPDKNTYEDLLAQIGFSNIAYDNSEPVTPTRGALHNHPADSVETNEDVTYNAVVATIIK